MVLPRALRDEVVAHARETAPEECCGLLLGDGETVRRVFRCRDVHPAPDTRYLIDTAQVVEVFRRSADFDRELVAIYHSHPRSPAVPSPIDRLEARWPDAAYVLVSLRADPPEIFGYRIKNDEMWEIPIVDG